MIETFRPFLVLFLAVCLQVACPEAIPVAAAQTVTATPAKPTAGSAPAAVPDKPTENQEHLIGEVDALAAKLKAVETDVDASRLTEGQLGQLAARVQPLILESQAIVEKLTPRAAAMKARLDQLGPAPDAKEPAENADISKERTSLQKGFDDNDGLLKRAKVLELKRSKTRPISASGNEPCSPIRCSSARPAS